MTVLLLVRHGRTAANASGTLAGWTPGVTLDDKGREQATALAARMAGIPVACVVTSPLERCQETADHLLADRPADRHVDDRLGECHYGDWTGEELKTLAKDPLWKVVQSHPSSVTFPGGESMRAMQSRAVDAVRDWNARLGDDSTWIAVSHGDVIKAIIADALGLHLDQFQRLQVDPCSLTAIRYTELRPFVLRLNDTGGSVDALMPPPRRRGRRTKATSDAAVGGGAGSAS
ncbi:MAG TPA: histidine phosphatase family protein [Candidatus Limnocylindria bacterium]|nr:histidine phosphatase family protein [Candidatus Limnocylindria bacterium]